MALLFSCFAFSQDIDLTKLDIYEYRMLDLRKLGGNLLIFSPLEQQMVLISPKGEEVARYDNKGQDPLGLGKGSRILGVQNEHVFVNTNGSNVYAFSQELKPSKKMGRFSVGIHDGGHRVKENLILVQTLEDFGFRELAFEEKQWHLKRELIPIKFQRMPFPGPTPQVSYFDGVITTCEERPNKSKEFEVKFYQYKPGEEMTLFAVARGEILPRMSKSAETYIDSMIFYQGKLVVLLTNFVIERRESEKQWLAIFNPDGTRLKEKELPDPVRIYPLHGSKKVYSLDEDTLILSDLEL